MKKYFSIFVVIVVYFGLYSMCVVSRVESVVFMGVDESSIIEAINSLFRTPYYNMLASYHSKFYGWSYIVINFIILVPFKLLNIEGQATNIIVRFVLFLIGMTAASIFYFVCRKFYRVSLSLIITLIFLTHPVTAHYFITIHPESTGTLFYLVGLLYLCRFVRDEKNLLSNYIGGVIAFSIASLSKQPYFIISFFTLLYFPYHYLKANNINTFHFLKSNVFLKVFVATVCISLIVAFIIHPFAFIDFRKFLDFQRHLMTVNSKILFSNVASLWADQIKSNPLVIVNFLLIFLPFIHRRYRKIPFIYSVIASSSITLLFIYKARYIVGITYLFPLYPIYILNISYAVFVLYDWLRLKNNYLLKTTLVSIFCLLSTPYLILNVSQTTLLTYKMWLLDGLSTKNLSWSYIESLPKNSKIAYYPTVAVPDSYRDTGCHVWQGCASEKQLKKYLPDYIFISWDYKYVKTEEWANFIMNNNYKKIDELRAAEGEHVDDSCGNIVNINPFSSLVAELSPVATLSRSLDCFNDLREILSFHSNGTIVEGDTISVYKK